MKTTRDAIFDALHTLDGHYRTLIAEQALLEEEALELAKKDLKDEYHQNKIIDVTRRHFIVLQELYPIMYFSNELSATAKQWIEYYDRRMKQAQELGAIKACDQEADKCTNIQCMHNLSGRA